MNRAALAVLIRLLSWTLKTHRLVTLATVLQPHRRLVARNWTHTGKFGLRLLSPLWVLTHSRASPNDGALVSARRRRRRLRPHDVPQPTSDRC